MSCVSSIASIGEAECDKAFQSCWIFRFAAASIPQVKNDWKVLKKPPAGVLVSCGDVCRSVLGCTQRKSVRLLSFALKSASRQVIGRFRPTACSLSIGRLRRSINPPTRDCSLPETHSSPNRTAGSEGPESTGLLTPFLKPLNTELQSQSNRLPSNQDGIGGNDHAGVAQSQKDTRHPGNINIIAQSDSITTASMFSGRIRQSRSCRARCTCRQQRKNSGFSTIHGAPIGMVRSPTTLRSTSPIGPAVPKTLDLPEHRDSGKFVKTLSKRTTPVVRNPYVGTSKELPIRIGMHDSNVTSVCRTWKRQRCPF